MRKVLTAYLLSLLVIAPMHASSLKETTFTENNTTNELKKITITSDIPYREGNSKSWLLDLAEPINFGEEGLRPAIVIVHGGGWRAGSKHHPVYRDLLIDYALQ